LDIPGSLIGKVGIRPGGTGGETMNFNGYTDSITNASVANGVLTITALKEDHESCKYTSARR
jgi:HSP20 family molecular chaperone IbpA